MRIQIVQFTLRDLTHEAFEDLAKQLAPMFSQVPGLLSKVWLSDPSTETYGGIYTWESAEAMADFARSGLFAQVAANPHFADLTARDFGVLEYPSRVTRGILAAAA